jgi:hypothetical protein
MKISAPYHISRRKRHAVLFKPFRETCVRKVLFHRTNRTSGSRSGDPALAWKMATISGAHGGTDHADSALTIGSLRLRTVEESHEVRSAFQYSFILNGNGHETPLFKANQAVNVELKVHSKEMEQNMIVVRSMVNDKSAARTQLQLQTDSREDCDYCQTYAGKLVAGTLPGVQSVVVEAIVRSSLYDTGAPISSTFWVFPVVIL